MDPIGIVRTIVAVTMIIKEHIDEAECNKKQSDTLYLRLDMISTSVNVLYGSSNSQSPAIIDGLNYLKATLDEALRLVKSFSEKKWFMKIIFSGNHNEQFQAINERLVEASRQLNLGLNVQQLVNAEQDKIDQANDARAIQAQQDKILKLSQETKETLQDMKMSQEEKHEVLSKQMRSMHAQLAELIKQQLPGATRKKSEISTDLTIPFFSLEIKEVLGKGSFGKVYRGARLGDEVAVKMIDHGVQESVNELVREIQIMSRLRSSHIVQLYGACIEPTQACLVMEYMAKGDLYQYLKKTVLSAEHQKDLILDIAKGLLYLHGNNVIHRDLKSANILIDAHACAKISDFGLSKISALTVASSQSRSESIQWMAPEVRGLRPSYSTASDIYSFGVIMWEILTGQQPYEHSGLDEINYQTIRDKHPGLLSENIPPVYRTLIQSCWAKKPEERPTLSTIIQQVEAFNPRPASPSGEEWYEKGSAQETRKDYAAAYHAYKKAADKGIWSAHRCCALFTLRDGLGGAPTDKNMAYRHLLLAAQNGNDQKAMYNLGRMYEKGDGIAENLSQALEWYKKAAKGSDRGFVQDAEKKIEMLTEQLVQTIKPGAR